MKHGLGAKGTLSNERSFALNVANKLEQGGCACSRGRTAPGHVTEQSQPVR